MEVEIRPEPSEAEREAILAALRQEARGGSPYGGAWRRAALEEALLGGEDDMPAR